MKAPHVESEVARNRSNRDDVTSFQVENPAYIRGTMGGYRALKHGSHTAVNPYMNPSNGLVEDLQVNIISSLDRHSQFSIMVLHTTCKMAERGTDRPVFDH